MFLYLHSEGSEGQIKGDPALWKSLGSAAPGRKNIFKYFLCLILSGALFLHSNFLQDYTAYASPLEQAISAAADKRADLFSNIIADPSPARYFFRAQSAARTEKEGRPLKIEDHVSYFNGLLVAFGFVIGVWLTVIMMIAVNWRLRLHRRDSQAKHGAEAHALKQPQTQNSAYAPCSDQESLEEGQLAKIGILKEILKAMADRLEKSEQSDPPQKDSKAAQAQEELEELLHEAGSLISNMEEDVAESAQKECRLSPAAPVPAEEYGDENPEHAKMHLRAKNLRADGCRLLAEDKTKEALCSFEESLSILQSLAAANPDKQLWQRDLVLAYHNMGRTMESLGLNREALDYFNEALKIASKQVDQNPGNLDWKRGLAASHSHKGRILASLGNLDEARRNFDKEIDIMLYMVNKQPENKPWQYALASAYHNMGQLLERLGQNRAALDVYKKDQAVLKRLVESEPNNSCWLYDLACVNGQMARMYKEQGRLKDALGHARRYLGAMRKLSEREPDNTGYRRELTVALGQVGRLLELRGEYDQARTTFKATLEIRRNLAETDPDNPTWQDDLLVCLYKMGDVYFAQKDYEGAWRYYQEALEMVEGLINKDGREDNWLMGKCGVLLRLGNLHQVHDAGTATNYYRSALNIAEQAHGDDDKESDWRELAGLIKKNMSHQEPITTH